MLMPERVKHRKQQRGRMRGKATRGNFVAFGDYGIQAMEPSYITSRQIEATRLVLIQAVRKTGKLWIRIFPDKPVTKKPAETRMGSGKGDIDHWVAVVKPGRILFEMTGIPEEEAQKLAKQVGFKLPIKVRLVKREEVI
ncbi:MAG: 50S ribosomal protein L16 [Caldisericota bacterium]|nr:50S ribosomal protein L16 [Caldisericota bacterium]